jgi:hypothetical protein
VLRSDEHEWLTTNKGGSVSFCGNCGARLAAGVRFCGECGTAVAGMQNPHPAVGDPTVVGAPPTGVEDPATARVEDPPTARVENPPTARVEDPPTEQSREPSTRDRLLSRLSPEALLAGDWLGAGRVAVLALSVMIAISLAAEMLSQVYQLGAEALIVSTLTLTAGALGGDTVYSYDSPAPHIGFTPLTITLCGASVLVFLVARWIDRHPAAALVDSVVQAARVVVVFSLLAVILALVGRGRIPIEEVASEKYSVHATVAGTFFGAMLLAVCAAGVAFALRPATLPVKVRRIRDHASGSVQALAISSLVAMALTALLGVVLILTVLDTGKLAALASLVVALPNATIYALLTGMGVSSQVTGAPDRLDPLGVFLGHVVGTSDRWVNLLDVTGKSAWFWLLSLGAVLFWSIAALLTVLREQHQPAARRNVLWLIGNSILFFLVGAWLTTTTSATEGVAFRGSWGPSAGGAFLLTCLWSVVAAFLAVGLAPQLRPSLGPLARRVAALSPARGHETDPTPRDG